MLLTERRIATAGCFGHVFRLLRYFRVINERGILEALLDYSTDLLRGRGRHYVPHQHPLQQRQRRFQRTFRSSEWEAVSVTQTTFGEVNRTQKRANTYLRKLVRNLG